MIFHIILFNFYRTGFYRRFPDFFIKFKRLLKILEYFCRIEITGMRETELKNFLVEDRIEAGCDEAGRGPLAGPVFAAAVIMPADFHHPLLNDSKQMSARSREILRPIIEAEAIEYAVVSVSAEEIDRMNILNASIAGMQRAVIQLKTLPEHLLIDGNRFRPFSFIASLASDSRSSGKISDGIDGTGSLHGTGDGNPAQTPAENECTAIPATYDRIPYSCIVKGDAKFTSIAAASVLAKTYRDEYMRKLAAEYPGYGWEHNMGYPTKEHIDALIRLGPTPQHRKSFHLKELEPALF